MVITDQMVERATRAYLKSPYKSVRDQMWSALEAAAIVRVGVDRDAWEKAVHRVINATTNVAIRPSNQSLKDEFVAAGNALDALVEPFISPEKTPKNPREMV